ncbi:MAG: DUF4159 domain-containing protein [Croceimicrobium sp.]|nr:DUF4159 domain-containing protein [Bacteroidota bacterium]
MRKFLLLLLFTFSLFTLAAQSTQLALVKYRGGGDWYANPTALPNLISFCNDELQSNLQSDYATVELGSSDIFEYPFLHITGHGNILFDEQESKNLEAYLNAGGFIHIDDNYGMDEYIRPQLLSIFGPEKFKLLSLNHPIFKGPYSFADGLPKIHEHDASPPEAWGVHLNGRLVLIYTFESDLGDGWEDPEVHNDPEDKRQAALKMGANIIHYAFNGPAL